MSFGERLRQLRKNKNLTLRELEKEIDISFSALGKYERNEREPDFDTLEKIASYFGVMIDWLIGRTDIKTFDEYVFINDTRHIEEKLKEISPEKRKIIVNIFDQMYLIVHGHLDDKNTESLTAIFNIIHNLFMFENELMPHDPLGRIKRKDPEDILDFLSSYKNQFNILLDDLFKAQLKRTDG